jgi:rfaE bifunctional protein kinase chain/domain
MSLFQTINSWKNKHALVLGDVMLDSYYYGTSNRMSPEAPVPIVDLNKKENRLGGAANVAVNLTSLGAKCTLVGVIGNDSFGLQLAQLCSEAAITNNFFTLSDKQTTVKTRIISDDKHLLRIDEENISEISDAVEQAIIQRVVELLPSADVLILQDYNKGVLSKNVIHAVINEAKKNQIPIVVDPKKTNFFEYKNCTLFKPNRKEMLEALNESNTSKTEYFLLAEKLRSSIRAAMVLTTLSEDGAILVGQEFQLHEAAHPRNIVDVSGAGDTVLSVAALCLTSDISKEDLLRLANLSGGLVCEYVGVKPLTCDALLKKIN